MRYLRLPARIISSIIIYRRNVGYLLAHAPFAALRHLSSAKGFRSPRISSLERSGSFSFSLLSSPPSSSFLFLSFLFFFLFNVPHSSRDSSGRRTNYPSTRERTGTRTTDSPPNECAGTSDTVAAN